MKSNFSVFQPSLFVEQGKIATACQLAVKLSAPLGLFPPPQNLFLSSPSPNRSPIPALFFFPDRILTPWIVHRKQKAQGQLVTFFFLLEEALTKKTIYSSVLQSCHILGDILCVKSRWAEQNVSRLVSWRSWTQNIFCVFCVSWRSWTAQFPDDSGLKGSGRQILLPRRREGSEQPPTIEASSKPPRCHSLSN